jgi:two-component system, NarL family, sensor histidine kinase LiaS
MRQRWGLRAKMSASYVLVTAAAVLVVEIVALVLVQPLLAPPDANPSLPVQATAQDYATRAVAATARLGRLPTAKEIQLGEPSLRLGPGQARPDESGKVVRIPFTGDETFEDGPPMSLALLLDTDRRIVVSSYPARYPVGAVVGAPETGVLPANVILKFGQLAESSGGQVGVPNGHVIWAMAPVLDVDKDGIVKGADKENPKPVPPPALGFVYVQVPETPEILAMAPQTNGESAWDQLGPMFGVGVLVLLGATPVGVVFGLLATRSLIRRLRRLAASTVAVADGQYQHRIPVSGRDEIAQLEGNFNRMAERLTFAMAAERHLASATERARIARELHDSISQDLFSLRLLAGGLRRALPSGSALQPQVEAMERTATGTMHEMQALLLELRPVALQDAGLVATLEELCQAYRDRLGVAVDADLEPVDLDPAVEHAVLRIVQEALANAVKHARPTRITVLLRRAGGQVTVAVTDNGDGFDPARAGERHGMGLGLMRERVAELGGVFEVDSVPGEGTTVRIVLTRGRP